MNLETIRRQLADQPELLAQVEKMMAAKGELSDQDLEQLAAGKGPVNVAVGRGGWGRRGWGGPGRGWGGPGRGWGRRW